MLIDLLHNNQEKAIIFHKNQNLTTFSLNLFVVKVNAVLFTGQAGTEERQTYSCTDNRSRRCKDGVVSPLSGRIPSGKDRIVQ